MAVTNNGNRIVMTAAADSVAGRHKLASVVLDHSAAATCVLQDTASKQIVAFRSTATILSPQIIFNPPLEVDGIKASTLSAGAVTLTLA